MQDQAIRKLPMVGAEQIRTRHTLTLLDVYDQSHSAADPVSYYNESATPKSTAQRPRKKGREEYMDPRKFLTKIRVLS